VWLEDGKEKCAREKRDVGIFEEEMGRGENPL